MFCKKEKKLQVFEKRQFPPKFNGLSRFNKNLNKKRPFYKKDYLWPVYLL